MKWTVILVILYLWTSWIGRYAVWFAEGSQVKLDPQQRFQYLVSAGKPALPLVQGINDSIKKGDIPSNVIVYGLGMEPYRFFADFELIGGLYGYANHADFMKAIEDGAATNTRARNLREWLRKYHVDYLAVDQWTVDFPPTTCACTFPPTIQSGETISTRRMRAIRTCCIR